MRLISWEAHRSLPHSPTSGLSVWRRRLKAETFPVMTCSNVCRPEKSARSRFGDDPVKPGAKVLRKTCARFRWQRIIHLSTFPGVVGRGAAGGLRMSEDEAYHPHHSHRERNRQVHVWMLNNPSEKSSKSSSLATDRWKLISSKFNFSFWKEHGWAVCSSLFVHMLCVCVCCK